MWLRASDFAASAPTSTLPRRCRCPRLRLLVSAFKARTQPPPWRCRCPCPRLLVSAFKARTQPPPWRCRQRRHRRHLRLWVSACSPSAITRGGHLSPSRCSALREHPSWRWWCQGQGRHPSMDLPLSASSTRLCSFHCPCHILTPSSAKKMDYERLGDLLPTSTRYLQIVS
jgi:hypothetical protein